LYSNTRIQLTAMIPLSCWLSCNTTLISNGILSAWIWSSLATLTFCSLSSCSCSICHILNHLMSIINSLQSTHSALLWQLDFWKKFQCTLISSMSIITSVVPLSLFRAVPKTKTEYLHSKQGLNLLLLHTIINYRFQC